MYIYTYTYTYTYTYIHIYIYTYIHIYIHAALSPQLFKDPESCFGRGLSPRPPAQQTGSPNLANQAADVLQKIKVCKKTM